MPLEDDDAGDGPAREAGRAAAFRGRDPANHPPATDPDPDPDPDSGARLRPSRPLVPLAQGPIELARPVFGDDAVAPLDGDLVANFAAATGVAATPIGERVMVCGRVLDQDARPVPNCLIEIWQANAAGRYRHVQDDRDAPLDPAFGGAGRVVSGLDGGYRFRTIRPGPYPWIGSRIEWRPAHIHISIFGAAFCQRLATQIYFEGDPLIARCPIATAAPDPAAPARMTARLDFSKPEEPNMLRYRLDLVLRGRAQSVFENRMEGL